MPEMLSGQELYEKLADIPAYNEEIRGKSQTERLIELSILYEIYLPSEMSIEIYSKLYLALLRSLQKKGTNVAIQQAYQNHNAIMRKERRGIIGGSDSFSIVGCSGIGKSSAINRAISIITENRMLEIGNPQIRIIPLKMYRKYEDVSSIVLGSGNLSGKTAKMKKAIASEIAKISDDKIFSGQKFLFGTSALDCGVSMRDYSFSIIIIDGIYDVQTIKQIVGRKRKQDDCDIAALYIRNISNSTLNGFNSAEKRWIKPAHTLLTKGIDYYLEWYLKNGNRYPDKHRIIRDEKINGVLTKTVNDKKLTFFENRIQRTTDMIRRGKNGFLLTLKDAFGINVSPWNDDAKIYTEKILEDHYQKQTVWWNRSETQEFAKSLGFTDKYRHIITSYKAINSILENQYNSIYRIVCKRKKKKVDGKVKRFDNVWMIEKIR